MANKQGKCEDCGKMMVFNPLKFYGGWGCPCWNEMPEYDHDIDYSDMDSSIWDELDHP